MYFLEKLGRVLQKRQREIIKDPVSGWTRCVLSANGKYFHKQAGRRTLENVFFEALFFLKFHEWGLTLLHP